jgi:hypothetical protein
MSVWWECSFCAIGPADEIERFRDSLPGLQQAPDDGWLWPFAKVKVRNAGFLCVEVSRNYGGMDHAEQMVGQFPHLTFVGSINADIDPWTWWTFDGRNGEATWHKFTAPVDETEPSDPIKEKALVERRISEIRERLADEQTQLAMMEEHLAIVELRIAGRRPS